MADAIHSSSLQLFFGTPARRPYALLDVLGRSMDDNAWLWLDYGSVFATIEVGYFSPLKKREVLVVGAEKSVVVDYTVQQDKVKIYANHHRKEKGEWKAVEGDVQTTEFDPEEPLLIELRAFLASLKTRVSTCRWTKRHGCGARGGSAFGIQPPRSASPIDLNMRGERF